MMKRLVLALVFSVGFVAQAQAQTVSPELVRSLQKQGFRIQSTGYTWLRRVVVRATNGRSIREIVIARGSGQILQDNIRPLSARDRRAITRSGRNRGLGPRSGRNGASAGRGGRGGGGRGGPGGPGGGGGPGGPGGGGGPGGPGGGGGGGRP